MTRQLHNNVAGLFGNVIKENNRLIEWSHHLGSIPKLPKIKSELSPCPFIYFKNNATSRCTSIFKTQIYYIHSRYSLIELLGSTLQVCTCRFVSSLCHQRQRCKLLCISKGEVAERDKHLNVPQDIFWKLRNSQTHTQKRRKTVFVVVRALQCDCLGFSGISTKFFSSVSKSKL